MPLCRYLHIQLFLAVGQLLPAHAFTSQHAWATYSTGHVDRVSETDSRSVSQFNPLDLLETDPWHLILGKRRMQIVWWIFLFGSAYIEWFIFKIQLGCIFLYLVDICKEWKDAHKVESDRIGESGFYFSPNNAWSLCDLSTHCYLSILSK